MCSFLFTASGMRWGMMVRHTHEKSASAGKSTTLPHFGWTVLHQFERRWREFGVIDPWTVLIQITGIAFQSHALPTWHPVFVGEGRGGNKQHRGKRECQFISSPGSNYSLGCCLAASPLHRNIERLEGRTYWRAAHNLFQFSSGKMTIQPCQMWIRSERRAEHRQKEFWVIQCQR